MRDDIEIKIKVIPIGEDRNEEENEMLKDKILDALNKTFYKGYKREELEEVTTLKQETEDELPKIFKRFGVEPEDVYRPNKDKYKRNKNYYRRRK